MVYFGILFLFAVVIDFTPENFEIAWSKFGVTFSREFKYKNISHQFYISS